MVLLTYSRKGCGVLGDSSVLTGGLLRSGVTGTNLPEAEVGGVIDALNLSKHVTMRTATGTSSTVNMTKIPMTLRLKVELSSTWVSSATGQAAT